MKPNFSVIIGHVTTLDIPTESGLVIQGATYPVIKVIRKNDLTIYVTNVIHKIHPDNTVEPLVILDNLVKSFTPKP